MGWPKGQGPIRSEASAQRGKVVGGMSKAPTFSSAQLRSIKQSPKGVLPKFLSVGNKKAGATLSRSKDGAEVQAGIGRTHVGAGFSKSRKSAGFDISRTSKKGKNKKL
jgi:hypothetical protein